MASLIVAGIQQLDPVLIDGETIPVSLRRNTQAKRMILRIDSASGDVKITVPTRVSMRAVQRFLDQHIDWVKTERAKRPKAPAIVHGMQIPYRGNEYLLHFTDTPPRTVTINDGTITVGGPVDQAPARLERWMRLQARQQLEQDASFYASKLGVTFAKISIGDMKTRWGSCSSKQTLKFNWRLILAPEIVRRYVAAHEVSHLLEMNHSARFWEHVAHCMTDYKVHRRWLKSKGDILMRLQFKCHQTGG